MEREGSTGDRSSTEPLQSGNVVRLPRDWLGPREELVPFGPATDAPPEPPSAQSFWTADAASLHAALNAQPVPPAAPAPSPPAPVATPAEPSTALRPGGLAAVRARLGTGGARLGAARAGYPGAGARTFAVAGVLALLVALSLASTLLSAGPRSRSGSPVVRSASTNWLRLPAKPLSLHVGLASASMVGRRRQDRRASDRRVHVSRSHLRVRSRRPVETTRIAAAPPASPVTSPGYQAPAVPPAGASNTGAAAAPVASAASRPPAPTKRPAYGLGGLLGAGSSPSG